MFTFMARFALVHFLHEAVQVYDPGHFLFQHPASYLGIFVDYCFKLHIQQSQILRAFHLNALQNKI